MADLPRVRVHDDGSVAMDDPRLRSNGITRSWIVVFVDGDGHRWQDWRSDEVVTGPGWRDAAIVPLPESVGDPVEWHGEWPGVVQLTTLGSVHLAGYGFIPPAMARDLAAALLAAAAHVDQAKAVSTNG